MIPPLSILLLLARLSLAARVYLQPPPPASQLIPSHVSPADARALLANHLSLDMLDPGSSSETVLWDSPFVGQGEHGSLIVTLDENVAKDVVPSSLEPTFSLPDSVSSAQLSQMVSSLLARAGHIFSTVSTTASAPPAPVPRILDIFTASSGPAKDAFLTETRALLSFVENSTPDSFGAFDLSGLSQLSQEFGPTSELYALAAQTTHELLQVALSKPNLHIALVAMPAARAARRAQPPQSPLPAPSPAPQLPIGGVSTCHASAAACGNATGACSGRGECQEASKAGRTCFVCACNVTRDDRNRREWWVGDACERKDISGPFVLLTGTVITLILLIGGSVSLLYGIGGQQLPPTLTGGAAGGSLKRE